MSNAELFLMMEASVTQEEEQLLKCTHKHVFINLQAKQHDQAYVISHQH